MMDSRLDGWRSILIIIVFLLTNITSVIPLKLPIPAVLVRSLAALCVRLGIISAYKEPDTQKLTLSYKNVPIIAVLFLLATTTIDAPVIRRGIIGTQGIHPLDIMSLFISLAYMAIALDATGLLRFLAFRVVQKGGSSGRRLYLYLYLFFFAAGLVVGNDPVILSGTAFLAYFTRMAGIAPPTAWTYSQFTAANLASSVLVSSNPTNLVLAGAFSLPYTSYSAFLILPTFIAALSLFPALLLLFTLIEKRRNAEGILIPRNIALPTLGNDDEREAGGGLLVDKSGAIIGSGLLLTTLGVLVGTSPIKPTVPVWRITVPGAVIMLLRDILADRHIWRGHRRKSTKKIDAQAVKMDTRESASPKEQNYPFPAASVSIRPTSDAQPYSEENISLAYEFPPTPGSSTFFNPRNDFPSPPTSLLSKLSSLFKHLTTSFPTPAHTLKHLPYPLIPFALSMFTLVEALQTSGWLEVFAGWWSATQARLGGDRSIGSILVMVFISSALCNVCGTNIGITILLARTLQLSLPTSDASSALVPHPSPTTYALALGSNIGAYTLSFSASLAGLLWVDILRQKGVRVNRSEFWRMNLSGWIVSGFVGGLGIWAVSKWQFSKQS